MSHNKYPAMKKGWPSEVEMRMHLCSPNGKTMVTVDVWDQRFLWLGFEESGAKRLEYKNGDKIVIFCVGPGFGIPLRVRWVRERPSNSSKKLGRLVEWDVRWLQPGDRLTCTQIWRREARRAGVALYLGLRRFLALPREICTSVAWLVSHSYEQSAWESARQ